MRTILLCPFNAGTVLWQAQNGGWTLTVCVRCTFSLAPGHEASVAEPAEPVTGDLHHGGDARAGLYAPSDLVPYKPRTDVMLVGSAYAPNREPVDALVARLRLGDLDKAVGVVGDRLWIDGPDGPEPSAPAPFRSMPLRDERAVRAPDNPLGFDLTRMPMAGAMALPNLEAADDEIRATRTIGFGPVLATAPTRRGLLDNESWAWVQGGSRGPLPAGFDFAFYNAAPRDQQLHGVRPETPLILENLHPRHARLETRIPSLRPKAFLLPSDVDRPVEVPLRCDTVWIDTDRGLITLSYRGYLAVPTPNEDALGLLVIASVAKGRELGPRQIAQMLDTGMSSTLTDIDSFVETRQMTALPRAAKPMAVQAEDTAGPSSWEELSSSDLMEAGALSVRDDLSMIEQRVPGRAQAAQPDAFGGSLSSALSVEERARIAVAIERGDTAAVLLRYKLTLADLLRLQAAWEAESAADPVFAAVFAAGMAAARRS